MKQECRCIYCNTDNTMDKGVYLCYECFFKLDDVQKMLFTREGL